MPTNETQATVHGRFRTSATAMRGATDGSFRPAIASQPPRNPAEIVQRRNAIAVGPV